jgi:hypothetical protein
MNPTQKTREIDFQGFTQESKILQATNWDIDDASRQEKISESKRMETEYQNTINEILLERSKHPAAFIDAEGLASHISIYSETNMTQARKDEKNKSNTNSSKSGNAAKNSKNVKSSNTNLNQSQTSD